MIASIHIKIDTHLNGVLVIILCGCTGLLQAQLSPGKLYKGHEHLEGLSNCTQCHTLGEKLDDKKCLNCHTLLNERISAGLGYHVTKDVKSKDCISCHSDHHGRNFEIIRFDQNKFNHYTTGYELEGSHAELDCASCHNPENITIPEIKSKEYTFLGLENECLSCHDDYHKNTLSTDCTSCHGFDAFNPAEVFDHDKTRFFLAGAHEEIECTSCHSITIDVQGNSFQEFSGIAFTNCTACHEDVHNNAFGQECTQCHNEKSFSIIAGRENFNHSSTAFPLRGKHRQISCVKCHVDGTDNNPPFTEFAHLQSIECTSCHKDIHEGKFGNKCTECHSEITFRTSTASLNGFDHSLTSYTLLGKHASVDCKSCHTENLTDPLFFNACTDCHNDYHDNQLVTNGVVRDCSECHSAQGFEESTYSIEQHNTTDYVLEGAHLATPCFMCHLRNEKWIFSIERTSCADCHQNIHHEFLDEKYYPNLDCRNCHNEDQWSSVDFDHTLTQYELKGQHREVECRKCHFQPTEQGFTQVYSDLSTDCSSCHTDIHNQQFMVDDKIDCSRCHDFNNWKISSFDHTKTDYPLDGAHIEVACYLCHKEKIENNIKYVEYKIKKFKCINCHL